MIRSESIDNNNLVSWKWCAKEPRFCERRGSEKIWEI